MRGEIEMSVRDSLTLDGVKSDILKCRSEVEEIFEQIKVESNSQKKQKLCKQAMTFILDSSTGYYSSDIIEQVYIDIAQKNTVGNLSAELTKDSVLHVMSKSFKTGGHTRVVERWIELSPEHQTHSLIFTRKEKHVVPDRLLQAVEDKKGQVIKLPDKMTDLEKGLELRKIASNYEMIVLHVHLDDIIPIIAFGHEEFTRPVMMFNHADHKFWVGGSITDIVVNLRFWGEELNIKHRGIVDNYMLPIPIDPKKNQQSQSKKEARGKLNLPQGKKIVTTVGAAHKYKPILEWNMARYIEKILEKYDDVFIFLIGPTFSDLPEWEAISKKYGDRILAKGRLLPQDMFTHIYASDLVLDSFPMSGGTALLDAVICQRPVLSLDCPIGQLDYITQSSAYCSDQDDLLHKAFAILDNPEEGQKSIDNVLQKFNKYNEMTVWKKSLLQLYDNAKSKPHTIKSLQKKVEYQISDVDIYLYSERIRERVKLHIPFFLQVNKTNKGGYKYLTFTFFSCLSFSSKPKRIQ